MLLWWLTAMLSFRSASHFLARALCASAVMFWAANNNSSSSGNNDTKQLLLEKKAADYATIATTMMTSSTSTPSTPSTSPSEPSSPFGVFSYGSSHNFNNYLKELGVSYLLRTFAGMASPIVTISRECKPEVRIIDFVQNIIT